MPELILDDEVIVKVAQDATNMVRKLFKDDLIKVILYGSCARGDYTNDSDIDIALIINSNRTEAKSYSDGIAVIVTELAMKYMAIVNFVCLPYEEFQEKKEWYAYFRNIQEEGEVLYGAGIL